MGRLKDITLHPVAEKDKALKNRDMFVKIDAYDKMLDDSGVLVIGRKGSGKTAIRLGLRNYNDLKVDMWTEVNLKSFSPDLFEAFLKKALPEYPTGLPDLLRNAWRVTLIGKMMAEVRDRAMVLQRAQRAGHDLKGMINRYFAKYSMTGKLFRFSPDDVLAAIVAVRGAPRDLQDMKAFPIDEEFLLIEQVLMWSLNDGLGAILTIDDLDPCLERYREILVPTVEGLVKAAQELVELHGGQGKLRVKCFVPLDIFSSFEYRHLDKLHAESIKIRWTAVLLQELLAKRFSPYVQLKGRAANDHEQIIKSVLGDRLAAYYGSESSFRFLVFFTHFRPRDVLFLTNRMFELAIEDNEDADSVPSDKAVEYLQVATRDYAESIIMEYLGKCPDLKKDVKALQGLPARVKAEELRSAWMKQRGLENCAKTTDAWHRSLRDLYDAGVVGYETREKNRTDYGPKVAVFTFRRPDADIRSEPDLVIHPLFWEAYDVGAALIRILPPVGV